MLMTAALASGCGEIKEDNPELALSNTQSMGQESQRKASSSKSQIKMFIGQDLQSIRGYVKNRHLPRPTGVTTYLAFYQLLNPSFPSYGGLGLDDRAYPTHQSVDWGAGPLNAFALAKEYPNADLNIGLNLAEGDQSSIWVPNGLKAIVRGDYDREINRLASFIKAIPNPVYLRIGYEFDGVWNRGYERKNDYIAAFRHIVNTLRKSKTSNAYFVWQASASPIDDLIESKREKIEDWYPGDAYVDLIGLSWFLTADQRRDGAATQRELANEVVQFARRNQKGVIIAEAAPQGYDLAEGTKANISPLWDGAAGEAVQKLDSRQIWQQWFQPFFAFINKNRDIIVGFSYINADWNSQSMWSAPYQNGYWGDSRIQSNKALAKLWTREVQKLSIKPVTED